MSGLNDNSMYGLAQWPIIFKVKCVFVGNPFSCPKAPILLNVFPPPILFCNKSFGFNTEL